MARAYVLYREERSRVRAKQKETQRAVHGDHVIRVKDGAQIRPLDFNQLHRVVSDACEGLAQSTSVEAIMQVNCLFETTIYIDQFLWLPYIPPPTWTPTSATTAPAHSVAS